MKNCVFAGTFDPFTVGHKDVVENCLKMFDGVVIAVMNNNDKHPLFTADERINFIKKIYGDEPRVTAEYSDGLLVDFMKEREIFVNVRGIRNTEDFKYETNMFYYNRDMYKDLITVYLPAPLNRLHVSSTAIRSLIKAKADISAYVPAEILDDIKISLSAKSSKEL